MNFDRLPAAPIPLGAKVAPAFLRVSPGDFVIVKAGQKVPPRNLDDWWMGQVDFCGVEARGPGGCAMFRVANVDDGYIYWVNGDDITDIVRSLDGFQLSSR